MELPCILDWQQSSYVRTIDLCFDKDNNKESR